MFKFLDRHGQRPILKICYIPDPPPFSLFTISNETFAYLFYAQVRDGTEAKEIFLLYNFFSNKVYTIFSIP
jgi:hypothetical protein